MLLYFLAIIGTCCPTPASSRPGKPRMPMQFIVLPTRLFEVCRNMLSSLELRQCQNLNRTFSRIAFTLCSNSRFTPSSRCTAYYWRVCTGLVFLFLDPWRLHPSPRSLFYVYSHGFGCGDI